MKVLLMLMILLMATSSTVLAKMQNEVIEYQQGDARLEGYLAYDDSFKGLRPGVLVVHDWTGVGPYVKARAKQLASLGYVAFAPDIYGKGIHPTDPKEAAQIAGIYKKDRVLMRQRANAGLTVLRNVPQVDPRRIGAIGYCFGGTAVLELARSGADIAAVVSFHGNLDTPLPEDGKNIRGKVLVLHGGDDPFVSLGEVSAFENEMRNAGVDWQLVTYGGAVHNFTNPDAGDDKTKGAAYNRQADKRSFEAMKIFFQEAFAN